MPFQQSLCLEKWIWTSFVSAEYKWALDLQQPIADVWDLCLLLWKVSLWTF